MPGRGKQTIPCQGIFHRNTVLVSAASAWELATKVRLGKLPETQEFEQNVFESVRTAGYELLPISAAVALRAGRLTSSHRDSKDPFDRIIAAQARAEDIPLRSADAKMDLFGVRRLW